MVEIDDRLWLAIQSNTISHLRNLSILITLIFMFETQLFNTSENNTIIIILCGFWFVLSIFVLDEYQKRKTMVKKGIPLYKEKRDYFIYMFVVYIIVIGLAILSKLKIINF